MEGLSAQSLGKVSQWLNTVGYLISMIGGWYMHVKWSSCQSGQLVKNPHIRCPSYLFFFFFFFFCFCLFLFLYSSETSIGSTALNSPIDYCWNIAIMIKSTSDITPSFHPSLTIGRASALLSAAWCIYLTALAIYRGRPSHLRYFRGSRLKCWKQSTSAQLLAFLAQSSLVSFNKWMISQDGWK